MTPIIQPSSELMEFMLTLILPISLFVVSFAFLLSHLMSRHESYLDICQFLKSAISSYDKETQEFKKYLLKYSFLLRNFGTLDYSVRIGYLIIIIILSFLASYPFYEVWHIIPGRFRQFTTITVISLLFLVFWFMLNLKFFCITGNEICSLTNDLKQVIYSEKNSTEEASLIEIKKSEMGYLTEMRLNEFHFKSQHKNTYDFIYSLIFIIFPILLILFHFWWNYIWKLAS